MRYFLDTEFIDDGHTIDLISIGIVSSDGREYYAQSVEFQYRNASEWVKNNVLKNLHMCPWADSVPAGMSGLYRTDQAHHKRNGQCVDQHRGRIHNCPWRTRGQLKHDILSFMDVLIYGKPELHGWCAAYDCVAFCQIFGTMMDLPQGYPHYIRDLQQVLDEHRVNDSDLPEQEEGLHNALADARHIKKLWGYIVRNDAWQ